MNCAQSWLPLSYVLAQYLQNNDVHHQFLTITERKYFEAVLTSYSTWIAFINQTQTHSDSNSELETACFRVRSMLYEQLIPHLFHKKQYCCHVLPIESFLSESRQLTMPSADDIRQAWNNFLETHVQIKQEEELPHSTNDETTQKTDSTMEEVQANGIKLEETSVNLDNVPLQDIYHSLEQDRAAMIEQRKLEEFEAQEELNEAEEAKENAAAKSLSIFNADGNFNLKYLLQGIVANRQKTSLTDRELQNLLSDFKPHRSKWANDERIGQEELYEACEKVLTDLKNYTEHSTPFLNKVSKREAPDYFDIIKKPMDLGTVTKKMKNLEYKSKKEFADDLYLIYDNCLTYNTNPASEYRKHAIAMRKKTDKLLVRVPNITVKEIKNEPEEEGDDMSEEEDHNRGRVSRKTAGKHMVSTEVRAATPRERERSMTRGSSAAPGMEEFEMTPEVETPYTGQYGGKHVKSSQSGETVDLEQEDMKLGAEIDADMGEFQDQIWRDKTKKTRARLTTDVEKQYQFDFGEREALVRSSLDMSRFSMIEHLHDKPESIAKLIRCEHDRFLKWTDRRPNSSTLYDDFDLDSSDDENLDAFFSKKIKKNNKILDDSNRSDLFLADYAIVSGVPEINGVPEDIIKPVTSEFGKAMIRKSSVDLTPENLIATSGLSNVPLETFPETRFPNYGLNPLIDKNISTLAQIRLMYAKCNAVKNNVAMSALTSPIELDSPISEDDIAQNQFAAPTATLPLILDTESSYQVTQKVVSKLLTHAGFEGTKIGAMNVLSDLMVDYMTNIAKTMRCYRDMYSHEMTGDEMICHTLYENGIQDISDLEDYVNDDVVHNVQRLEDLNRRLQTSYQELLNGPIEKSTNDEELLNEEEAFTTGIFGEDIGEDYFGFKNLGLDKEYNLDNLHIPTRLWMGKDRDLPIKKVIEEEPLYRFQPPPCFVPLTSEKPLIGLLQPYFAKKLSDPSHPLIEDEYIPNRNKNKPRYPPSNKPTQGRKKLNKTASGTGTGPGGEHKKNKRKRPPEEINAEKAEKAERRRLKLEEREKRIAEKEQKRKLRVELKEQEKQAKIEAKEKKKLMNKKSKQKVAQPNEEEED